MKGKTPNTERGTSNGERRIIRWIGDGSVKEDAPGYAALCQTDSTPNPNARARQEIHMKMKKTSNTERRMERGAVSGQ
jgi:hypothetical protein